MLSRCTTPLRILFLLFVFFGVRLTAQDSAAVARWMEKNATPLNISLDTSDQSLQLLDDDIRTKQIFFAGEYHDHSADYELKLKMLLSLYRKAGVRLVVEERPYSVMYMLDHLMMIGDEDGYTDYAYWVSNTVKERVYYSTIFAFNQKLPPSERIRMRGAAEEQVDDYAIRSLDTLLAQAPISPVLRTSWYDARTKRGDALMASLALLHAAWTADSTLTRAMGPDYDKVEIILRNYTCKHCDPSIMSVSELSDRESLMYTNYLKILQEFPGAKCFSQFGTLHGCLQPDSDWYWLTGWSPIASRLNTYDNSPVRGKVGNIVYLFRELDNQPQFFPQQSMSRYIWKYRRGDFTLLKINGEGTPFGTLADRLHYIVLVDYDWEKEKAYNKLDVNDPYDVMRKHEYICAGVFGSVQYGDHSTNGELGLMLGGRDLRQPLYRMSAGISVEWDGKEHINDYKLMIGGGGIVTANLSLLAATDYRHTGCYARPEIGVTYSLFELTAGYNIKLIDKYLRDRINRGLLTLRVFLPLRRQP